MTQSGPSSPEEVTGRLPLYQESDDGESDSPHPATPLSYRDEPQPPEEEASGSNGDRTTSGDSRAEVEGSLAAGLHLDLAEDGGISNLNALLAKAVPTSSEVLDASKVKEWSYKDIARMPDVQRKEWTDACRQELDSLRARDVYDLVDPPRGRRVIKNRWVFDVKTDGRKRARLVAKGFSQVEGIDYSDIFSPVVRYESARLMFALASLQNWHMRSVDVRTAFLYGELDEELYMEQPEGFSERGKERKVMRLKKAIYGLKQAALEWWRALDKSLKDLGFRRTKSDSGIYVLDAATGPIVYAIVYVDDIIFLGSDLRKVNDIKERFKAIWECRDMGETMEFLRMKIRRNGAKVIIDQCDYLRKIMQRFGMQNAKAAATPLPSGYVPTPNTDPVDAALRTKYQQVIGSLLYLMLGTRPDIAYAVTRMSQFAANPSKEHLDKSLYIFRYLASMQDYTLEYGRKEEGLIAYADADWGSETTSRRSTSGFMIKLGGAAVSWTSKAQKTVALSSTEAEYMSLSDTSRQLVWTRSLMQEIGFKLGPLPLCGDNQGAIFIASNAVQEKRTKHIDIRYHYIREVVEQRQIDLFFIPTEENPADMFTKNLARDKFLSCRSQLGIRFGS